MVPGEIAVRSRTILHHNGLAERLLEVIRNLPGQRVGRAAGHKGHDQVHGSRRIDLRMGEARRGRKRGSSRGQAQKSTAWKSHHGSSRPAGPTGRARPCAIECPALELKTVY